MSPNDRFTKLIAVLEELAYFHRAAAHILAGWSPKIADLGVKAACARHAFEDLDRAQQLSGHVWALVRGVDHQSLVPAGFVALMKTIDGAGTAAEMLYALYGVVRRHLIELEEALLRELSPVLDATLFYILPLDLDLLRRQLSWAHRALAGALSDDAALFTARVEMLWQERHVDGARVPFANAIWAPLDRVPNAARPPSMRRGIPGAMRLLPIDSSMDSSGIGLFLHNLVNGEYTTLELASRSLYEHPDMPPAFHLHLARQASDEARHARAIEDLAAEYGVRYGDYPIYTLTYDGYYAFEPCAPGSKRELCFRLLVRGTIDEGLALDDFAYQEKRREVLGQPRLAELFRYLLADELFHAQAALKWSRFLCGEDEAKVIEEREAANAAVSKMLDARRHEFVAAHPDAALAELEHRKKVEEAESKYPLPFDRTMNLKARKEAGYTDRDLEQVIRWGYAMPLRFAKDSHDPDQ